MINNNIYNLRSNLLHFKDKSNLFSDIKNDNKIFFDIEYKKYTDEIKHKFTSNNVEETNLRIKEIFEKACELPSIQLENNFLPRFSKIINLSK